MAGRGPQSFKKRQKEQQRKEKQQMKLAKKIERRRLGPLPDTDDDTLESIGIDDDGGDTGADGEVGATESKDAENGAVKETGDAVTHGVETVKQ